MDSAKIWRGFKSGFGTFIDVRCKICAEAVKNCQAPELIRISCQHTNKEIWVYTQDNTQRLGWSCIRERPAEVSDELCQNKRCTRGSNKCPLAHSEPELRIWKTLHHHGVFVHDFLQDDIYGKEEQQSLPSKATKSNSTKKGRSQMNRHYTKQYNDRASEKEFKHLLNECGDGRFLFVCQNCYSLDPHIVIEMEMGEGKDPKLRCKWCVRGHELLVHETITVNKNKISFYEYEVVRHRLSATKANALCRMQPNCQNSKCTFAHSHTELQVWKMETNNVSRVDLVKYCNSAAPNDRPTLDGMFHCDLCCLSFSNHRQYQKYMKANHEHFPEIKRQKNTWVYRCPQDSSVASMSVNGYSNEDVHTEWQQRVEIMKARSSFVLKREADSYTCEVQYRLPPILSEGRVKVEVEEPKKTIPFDTKKVKWVMKITSLDSEFKLRCSGFPQHPEFEIRNREEQRYGRKVELDDQAGPDYNFLILFTNPNLYGKHVGDLIFEFGSTESKYHLRFEVDIVGESIDIPEWNIDQNDWTQNRFVIKHPELTNHRESYEECINELKNQYKMPKTTQDVDLKYMTPRNYADKMHTLLYSEEKAREDKLSRMNLKCEMEVKGPIYDGCLLASFSIPISVSTDEGVLFKESCGSVCIGKENDKFAYECVIKHWDNEEILLSVSPQGATDLELKCGERRALHIQFRLDRTMFCLRHYAVDRMKKKASLICPLAYEYARIKYKEDVTPCEGLDHIQTIVYNYLHLEKEKWPRNAKKPYPPLIVAGPFGTGKTHTIKAILFDLLRKGDSTILLCTHSNSAADLYLEDQRMWQWRGKILRLVYHGRDPLSVKKNIRESFCLLRNNKFCYPPLQDLRKYRAVITTFSTALVLTLETGLPENNFTHILLDEASQAMEADVIMPMLLANNENTRILLAGDHRQMTERMYCDENNQVQTLLERMYESYENVSKKSRILLTNNYRCVEGILQLIVKLFYKENILNSASDVNCLADMAPVYFVHLEGECVPTLYGDYVNKEEAYQLMLETKNLVLERKSVQAEEVVVVSTFYQQVILIREIFRKNGLGNVSVQTVRNIQGQQYKVVMLCSVMRRVHCLHRGENFGFLSDSRLLNTALTRAQSMIVAVGDAVTLCSTGHCEKHWKAFIKHCEENTTILPETVNLNSIKMGIRVAKQKLNISAAEFRLVAGPYPVKQEVLHTEVNNEPERDNENDSFSDDLSLDEDDNDSWCSEESEDDLILDDMIKKITGIDVGKLTIGVGEVGNEFIQYDSEDEDPNNMSGGRPGRGNIRRREAIYPKYTVAQLEQLLRKDSKRYKHCKIKVENWFSAKAIPLPDETSKQVSLQHDDPVNSGNAIEDDGTNSSIETDEDYDPDEDCFSLASEPIAETVQQTLISPVKVNPVIFIETRQNLGRTFDQDEALVEILERRNQYAAPETGNLHKQKQIGKVLGVLRKRYKNPRERYFLCRPDEFNPSFMCPIDKKLPKFAILVPKEHRQSSHSGIPIYKPILRKKKWVDLDFIKCEEADDKRVYVVRYLKWSEYCPYPLGYVENSFQLSDYQRYLKLEYGLPSDFKNALKEQARAIKPVEFNKSPIEVFTIDPEGSMDLDDAISCEKCDLPNHLNCFKIGIHITDVASLIKEGSDIDKEAQRRFATFYGSDDAPVHMLPSELSTSKCSILPDEIRPAISTYFHTCHDPPSSKGFNPVTPETTFIKSTNRLTYREAEDLIRAYMRNEHLDENVNVLAKKLYELWQIMWDWRVSRLDAEAYYKNMDSYRNMTDECRAHLLIEEAMITVNANTASYLTTQNFEFPLRVQEMPDEDDWQSWERTHLNLIPNSNYLSSCRKYLKRLKMVEEGAKDSEDLSEDEGGLWEEVVGKSRRKKKGKNELNQVLVSVDPISEILIFKNNWEDMLRCKERDDLETFSFIAACDDLHPSLVTSLDKYRGIQKKSDVVSTQAPHFSLRIDSYTWSSSPIRRYIDIIIQRYLHKALAGEQPTSLMDEVTKRICLYFDDRHKMYEQKLRLTEIAQYLKWHPVVMEACIMQITDAFIKLAMPSLGGKIPHHSRELLYGYLMARNTSKSILEKMDEEKLIRTERGQIIFSTINLVWKLRYYNCRDDIKACKKAELAVRIPSQKWISFVQVISSPPRRTDSDYRKESYKGNLHDAVEGLVSNAESENAHRSDRMCGMTRNNPSPIYHQREITWKTYPGTSVLLQLSGSSRGVNLPTPSVQLVAIADDLDVCVEHMRNPIDVFAFDAGLPKGKAISLKSYQKMWEPLVRMDAANSAVKENSSITLQGVQIWWKKVIKPKKPKTIDILDDTTKSTPKLGNYFKINNRFCYERYIDFHWGDLLCLRLKGVPCVRDASDKGLSKMYGTPSCSTHTAVLHAKVTHVDTPAKSEEGMKRDVKVFFEQLGGCMKDEQKAFVENPENLWTVEVVPLSLVHRYMQGSFRKLKDCSELVKSICLGNIHPSPVKWDQEIERKVISRRLKGFPYELNNEQCEQERKAVRSNFTLIQGPPGTGKSFMAAQIAAKFAYINREIKKNKKVLYCGPSNKSVDVAAGFLKDIQGLRVVRMYSNSLEEKLYSNPLKPTQAKAETGDDGKMPDETLKRIALHEIIRSSENPRSKEIKSYDSSVKNPTKSFSRKEMDYYSAIVNETKKDELMKSDIIICTCSKAALLADYGMEFEQCIVDECAMCSEPETILPLVMANPSQIVLIGDHKQLRPVVTCNKAEKLGLGVSLFSRYIEFVGMLTNQYRMHPDIMSFPSKQFYEGKLTCDESVLKRTKRMDGFPKKKAIFWHVKGEERIQHFKTAEEGDQSKYNRAEAFAVIKILIKLRDNKVLPNDIMVLSPYTAQCARIREIIRKSHDQLKDVHVGTVVTSQGSEADYVILSTVRSLPDSSIMRKPNVQWLRKNLGFLTDQNQINVALTRARRRLFIIGNGNLLQVDALWNKLLESYEKDKAVFDNWPFQMHRSSMQN